MLPQLRVPEQGVSTIRFWLFGIFLSGPFSEFGPVGLSPLSVLVPISFAPQVSREQPESAEGDVQCGKEEEARRIFTLAVPRHG